jgi:hypothetical protein
VRLRKAQERMHREILRCASHVHMHERLCDVERDRRGHASLTARGESLAAFDGRCIPAGGAPSPEWTDPGLWRGLAEALAEADCSSLTYCRCARSSRLAAGAPRPSRCDARLSPRAVDHEGACLHQRDAQRKLVIIEP